VFDIFDARCNHEMQTSFTSRRKSENTKPLISHNAQSFIDVIIILIIIINLIITRMPVPKICIEKFVFSPSARNGAVTEGDADCGQVLSVSYTWTAVL